MAQEKAVRFLFSLLGFGGKIERHKAVIREEMQEGRSLAGLSGSSQDDHGPGLRRALQVALNIARNPHMQNIRYSRIICTIRIDWVKFEKAKPSGDLVGSRTGAILRRFSLAVPVLRQNSIRYNDAT